MAETSQTAPARDATALEIFQNQWEVYRKFLKYDYLSNGEAAGALRQFLTGEVARPYRFLDLACGDASGIAAALKGTPIQQYRGVDLSAPALAIASANLAALPCPAELDEADFSTALRDPSRAADIVWISLSLHHLDTAAKLAFMREVRQRIDANGAFLIYEPARRDGEDRPAYLDRLEAIGRARLDQAHAGRVRRGVEARAHVRPAGDGFRLGAAWPRGRIFLLARAVPVADRPVPAVPL